MDDIIIVTTTNSITFSSLNKCRTCLGRTLNPTTLESLKGSFQMLEILPVLTFLNVQVVEGLAVVFCADCMSKLQNMLLFRKQCLTTHTVLQQLHNLCIKTSDVSPVQQAEGPLKQVNVKTENFTEEIDVKTENLNGVDVDKIKVESKIESVNEEILNSSCNEMVKDKLEAHNVESEGLSDTSDKKFDEVSPPAEAKNPEVVKVDHKSAIFPCDKCKFVCDSKQRFNAHYQYKHNTVCNVCNKKLKNSESLRHHRRRIHLSASDPKPFCKLCGKFFASKGNLDLHHRFCHTEEGRQKKCEVCGKFVRRMKDHLRVAHATQQRFSCTICNNQFKYKGAVVAHMKRVHEKERTSLCPICGHLFATHGELNVHMYHVHSEQKNYKCGHCNRLFKKRSHCNLHERTVHLNIRPYTCEVCSRAFKSKPMLNKHSLIHTGEKPFACDLCSRPFRVKCALRTHKKLVHRIIV